MGNNCFGRVDEPESPGDSTRRAVNNSEESNTTRLRHPVLRPRNLIHEYYLPQYYENDPIFHPAPGVSRPMSQLTEDEQVMIATRLGLLSTLPMFVFDESKKEKFIECIICMCEYIEGEECRHLPCLHTFHRKCIDDWLVRSFTCPSCLDKVDAVLLSSQNNKNKNSAESGDSSIVDAGDGGSVKRRKRRSHHHHHHHHQQQPHAGEISSTQQGPTRPVARTQLRAGSQKSMGHCLNICSSSTVTDSSSTAAAAAVMTTTSDTSLNLLPCASSSGGGGGNSSLNEDSNSASALLFND